MRGIRFFVLVIALAVQAQTPDTLFTRTYGGPLEEWLLDVKQTSDGGFIACGHTESWGNGREDAYVIKIDAVGNLEWQQTYGTSIIESA